MPALQVEVERCPPSGPGTPRRAPPWSGCAARWPRSVASAACEGARPTAAPPRRRRPGRRGARPRPPALPLVARRRPRPPAPGGQQVGSPPQADVDHRPGLGGLLLHLDLAVVVPHEREQEQGGRSRCPPQIGHEAPPDPVEQGGRARRREDRGSRAGGRARSQPGRPAARRRHLLPRTWWDHQRVLLAGELQAVGIGPGRAVPSR